MTDSTKVVIDIKPGDCSYKIAIESFNGKPAIGIDGFSVAIYVEDWPRFAEAAGDAIDLWRKNAGFRDIP